MRLISQSFLIGLVLILFSSCAKNILDLDKQKPEIIAARQWVQQNQDDLDEKALQTKSAYLDAKFLERTILWEDAVEKTDSKTRTVIEVPVTYPNGMAFGVTGTNPPPKSIRTSLILVKIGPANYVPYFLKVYSDDPSHVFDRSNFFDVGYLNIPEDFSGEFNIYNWDESWQGSSVYKEGKQSGNRVPKKQQN